MKKSKTYPSTNSVFKISPGILFAIADYNTPKLKYYLEEEKEKLTKEHWIEIILLMCEKIDFLYEEQGKLDRIRGSVKTLKALFDEESGKNW